MEFTGLSDSPKAARKAAERTRQRKKGAFAPRPKQVQLQSLQAKLDELLEQYKAAEAENKRLKERLTLIEVVLPTREHQAKIAAAAGSRGSSGALPRPLQATPAPAGTDGGPGASPGLSPRYPLSPSPSPATGPDAASSVSASTPSGSGQAANNRAGEEAACAQSRSPQPLPGPQLGPPASGGAGLQNLQHPRALASEPPTVLPGQTPPQPQPLSLSLQHAGHAASAAVAVAAKRRPGRRPEAAAPPPQPPPPGDDDGLSAAWRALWMAWVRDAALLIVAHDARPGGGYWLQRLDEACTRLKTQVVQLGLKHPELIADDMPQLNLDTGRLQEPPEGHWRPVALAMRATSAQVAACRAALALYRERMEVVMAERGRLTERLADSMAALGLEQEAEGGGRGRLLSTQQLERTSVEAAAAAAELDANVAAEGRATKIAKDLLSSDMFTALQCARGSMASYPYFPDALAIITEVAKLGG